MDLKITGSLILNTETYFEDIERLAGDFLFPNPKGRYIPGQVEPLLYEDRQYYYLGEKQNELDVAPQFGVTINPRPITDLDDIVDDVYDIQANLIVSKEKAKLLTKETPHSLRVRNLVGDIVDAMIQRHSHWQHREFLRGQRHSTVLKTIQSYLLEPYQSTTITTEKVDKRTMQIVEVDVLSEERKALFYKGTEICEAIALQLEDPIRQVLQFLGEDHWIMFFARARNTEIVIEKTIDFRIYDWMRRFAKGYDSE